MQPVRTFLRGTLPPGLVHFVRLRLWWCSSYLPRLLISPFVERYPDVQRFGGASNLVEQLRSINVLAGTEMCRVMTKYGSDKGRGRHNYTGIYSALFSGLSDEPLKIFELGIGTINLDVASSMGRFGQPGASLRGWRELFPHALVFGADVDRAILFREDRIKTFYCDQLDQASIRELWSQSDLQGGMDIIIEDGLHTFEANVSFLEGSLDHLRPGGFYVVEDVHREYIDKWRHRIEAIYSQRYPRHEFAFVALPHRFNLWDNNLLVIRRGV